ncbi:diguanylate cyclase [Veronia pacifica]|uniref:diguanylate cyclase n=1 Tax=Veronia pacifica TaxID=1080227 RepID=A0A1C3EGT7_9GAMM|nr:diguanylate cyclase [Veronia pacifica]
MFDWLLLLVTLLSGAVIGALWVRRHRIIEEKTWRQYLSNLSTPKAIAYADSGEIFFANQSSIRGFELRFEQGIHRFDSEDEQTSFSRFIRMQPWPKCFANASIDFGHHTASNQSVVDVSGLPLWIRGKKAWVLTLDINPRNSQPDPFFHSGNQIMRSVIDALAELVCFQNREGMIVGTNLAFDTFWSNRQEEGLFFGSGLPEGRRTVQNWVTDPSGNSCLLETSQTLIRGDQGQILGSLSISHDVTNWHMMQQVLEHEIEARQTVEQELKKRSNLLESIFEASADPIGMFNEHYVYLGANKPYAEAVQANTSELEGKRAEDIIEHEILSQNKRLEDQVLATGEPARYEDLVLRQDGSQVWYEVTKTQFKDPVDDTLGVLVIARDITERKATQQQLADAIMELEELSFVDSLTKVANRRSLDEKLTKMWSSHARDKQPLSLILCDIDNFKAYNDNYGHQSGDKALRAVAGCFQRVVRRPLDFVARYGGEEFAILLPNTPTEGAVRVAENIAESLRQENILHEFSALSDRMTLSQGIATLIPEPSQDYGMLVELADTAMYRAKNSGKAKIECATEVSIPDAEPVI